MMEKMRNRKKRKGFTLIELIVVIAILGILAAIAIPRLGAFTDRAKISTIETNHRTIVSALNTDYATDSDWPADLEGVKALLSDEFTLDSTKLKLTDTSGGIHTWDATAKTLTTTGDTTKVTGFTQIVYNATTGKTTP